MTNMVVIPNSTGILLEFSNNYWQLFQIAFIVKHFQKNLHVIIFGLNMCFSLQIL